MLGSREEKVALKAMWHDAKHYLPTMGHMPPWRNWLARSAVNRKVGGSSPPGGAKYFVDPPFSVTLRHSEQRGQCVTWSNAWLVGLGV